MLNLWQSVCFEDTALLYDTSPQNLKKATKFNTKMHINAITKSTTLIIEK